MRVIIAATDALSKSANPDLVQKRVIVHRGQTSFPRRQWVRPGGTGSVPTSAKQPELFGAEQKPVGVTAPVTVPSSPANPDGQISSGDLQPGDEIYSNGKAGKHHGIVSKLNPKTVIYDDPRAGAIRAQREDLERQGFVVKRGGKHLASEAWMVRLHERAG